MNVIYSIEDFKRNLDGIRRLKKLVVFLSLKKVNGEQCIDFLVPLSF